ncbi:MAG: hypothetical protein U1E26_07045 [Coriobacteriia bacterium]|nr:hypothetical protein [Coriobacteriia bacterium]
MARLDAVSLADIKRVAGEALDRPYALAVIGPVDADEVTALLEEPVL